MIRPNSYLENLVREPQHFDKRAGVMRLDMNEYVPFPSQSLYEKWKEKMTDETISAYPMVNNAYLAISKLTGLDDEKIVLTTGSDGVVLSTLLAFCEPGDTIGMVAPTYGMYGVYANMLGLRTKEVTYDGFDLDYDGLINSITPEIKVFLLANPNGVVGEDLPREVVLQLIKKANKCGTVLLLDEVYAAFEDRGKSRYEDLIDQYDNLVIARSFSKSYGLAGLRAGYAIACKKTRKYLLAVRPNVEINSAAVTAVNIWCEYPELLKEAVDEIVNSRNATAAFLEVKGIEVKNGSGNFILAKIPDEQVEALKNTFENEKIDVKWMVIQNENWIRITVATRTYMERFFEVMENFLKWSGWRR